MGTSWHHWWYEFTFIGGTSWHEYEFTLVGLRVDMGRVDMGTSWLLSVWGTGLIASSSTFYPHLGRVTGICSICHMLYNMVRKHYSLQQSSTGSCSPHESGHNLRADCQWCTLVPPFDNSANAALVSVQALSAVQTLMLAVVALKQPAIEF